MTFVAWDSLEEATAIVRTAVARQPNEASLWFHLGRASQDPAERYHAYARAESLGFRHPSLLTWLGKAAFDARDDERAEQCGRDLLGLAEGDRRKAAHTRDWPEKGELFWERARQEGRDRAATREFAEARSDHAFHKHNGHTLMGLVACRRGKLEEAADHLRSSAELGRIIGYLPTARRFACSECCWQKSSGKSGSTICGRGSLSGTIPGSTSGLRPLNRATSPEAFTLSALAPVTQCCSHMSATAIPGRRRDDVTFVELSSRPSTGAGEPFAGMTSVQRLAL